MKQATITLVFDTGYFSHNIDNKTAKKIALQVLIEKNPKVNRNNLLYRKPLLKKYA